MPLVFVLDNHDSFTFNLVHLLRDAGADVCVRRPESFDLSHYETVEPSHLLISPGPGHPQDARIARQLLENPNHRRPILGVCLGHQCLGLTLGLTVGRAPEPVHGRAEWIHHDGQGVFKGVPSPFNAMRYHSLMLNDAPPLGYDVSARNEEGLIMAIRAHDVPFEGVQFHPESFLTDHGPLMIRNFLRATL